MRILLLFTLLLGFAGYAQKTVQFRISTAYSDVDDMDGFGSGNSDPQWDYEITDNTFGISDNGSTELGGTDCPGWVTFNDQFFSQQYDCELPASYTFIWSGFEDDGIGSDANTGNQTVNFTSASINPNQTAWTTVGLYTAFASGDPCGSGGTVTWRINLQYRVVGSSLCNDECLDPYVLPTAAEYDCGPTQTSTPLNVDINATEPADPSQNSYTMAGITCTYDGSSAEDIWIRTTIPDSSGGVNIQFENEGGCTGFACQTNITYAWYTSSDGTCAGLEYRGCGSVSCFIGCSDGEIQVDGIAGEDVWVRIWEEDDQGFNITINQITPTAPADRCYTALPLSGFGCNYQATSPTSGLYAEPDISSWTAGAHPGGVCQDGDSNPSTNTVWASNENMVWYTYTHNGGDFNLAVDNMNCVGGAATAQIGVFSNSGGPDDPSCNLAAETGYGCSVGQGAVQLSIASLPPGDYIIVVDGNAGAQCDWIFTDFVGNDPLPIDLYKFDAKVVEFDVVELFWTTLSERDNDYFTIERSIDGVDWEELFYVDGAGTTFETNHYSTFDTDPYYGISYYRLKQTDTDGNYSYSTVRSVNNKGLFDVKLYPNPASDHLFVEISSDLTDQTEFSIVDAMGQAVPVRILSSAPRVKLDVSELSRGIYFLVIEREGVVQKEKFVIERSY